MSATLKQQHKTTQTYIYQKTNYKVQFEIQTFTNPKFKNAGTCCKNITIFYN